MTRPTIKTFDGGALKAVAPGDTYQKPDAKEPSTYDRCKLILIVTVSKKEIEIPKNVWMNMLEAFDSKEITEKLKYWE
jgi:hypothetical protein